MFGIMANLMCASCCLSLFDGLIYSVHIYLYWKCIGILMIASPSWQSTQTFEKCSVSPVLRQNSLSDHFILGWDSNFTRKRTKVFTKSRLWMQLSFKMYLFCYKKKLSTPQTKGHLFLSLSAALICAQQPDKEAEAVRPLATSVILYIDVI